MSNGAEHDVLKQDAFYDIRFSDLKLDNTLLINKVFENCRFVRSSFIETTFNACKFVSCEFTSCNLSAAQIRNSSFIEVIFDESNLPGVNWTQAKWPYIALTSPIAFYRSNISHSSFYELALKEIVVEECKAHNVDFREADFSRGNFMLTDFEGSLFLHTKLQAADFSDASNYHISPVDNDIRQAKFSMPDVINLLHCFDITIQGI